MCIYIYIYIYIYISEKIPYVQVNQKNAAKLKS